jgi:hypothetical protein
MLSQVVVTVLLAGAAWTITPGGEARADVQCTSRDSTTGVCLVQAGGDAVPLTGGSSSSESGPVTCWSPAVGEVPCQTEYGWWDNGRKCYLDQAYDLSRVTDPAAVPSQYGRFYDQHGLTGVVMFCATPYILNPPRLMTTMTWFPSPPAPLPDPLVLAEQAVAKMGLEGPEMGVWPGDWYDLNPKAWGAVRIPVWFWAKDAKPGVSGVATASASSGGQTVIAQARLSSVTWSDDAGHRVVCGLGSVPHAWNETAWESPSGCGWTYDKEGDYTVTAVTRIRVDWSGYGRSGVIDLTFTAPSHTLRIGEIQVVVRSGGLS